eukprot:524914_1
MSEAPLPAYSVIDNREGNNASPPAYNAQASKSSHSAYNPSAAASQPVVHSADQDAVTPNIEYVDQNGIDYLFDSPEGNPINVAAQPVVKFVDQSGNPVRQQKKASAVLGGIALLLLVIGLCLNSLAIKSTNYSSTTCTWTAFSRECRICAVYSTSSYSALCDRGRGIYDTDTESYDTDIFHGTDTYDTDTYDTDIFYNTYSYVTGPTFCGTQTAAALALAAMIISTIFTLVGVIYVQPYSPLEPACCKTNPQWTCGRALFSISITFSILSLVIWLCGDEVCLGDNSYMTLGESMICQIIAAIFASIAAILAR